ncbi:hypothetical protein IAU60_002557 [Kwoniella sp. DSM 27419]
MSPRSATPEARDLSVDAEPRKRKQRPHLNCAECRRLKLRCDRTVPCANCVKRSCIALCPNGARAGPRKSLKRARTGSQDGQHAQDASEDKGEMPTTRPRAVSSTSARSQSTRPVSIEATQSNIPQGARQQTEAAADAGDAFGISLLQAAAFTTDPTPSHHDINPMSFGSASMPPPSAPPIPTMRTPTFDEANTSPAAQSHGTLVISHTGSSKYLGPSAASEWLKDAEVMETLETPALSRAASPHRQVVAGEGAQASGSSFPFTTRSSRPGTTLVQLLGSLPSQEEAEALADSYHRYFGWSYDIVSRTALQKVLATAYAAASGEQMPIDYQQLGLLFIALAMGALHNLELPPEDSCADEFLLCSEDCLARGRFMTTNTMAGVQTLIIMAHFHLETDKGRNGDSAWALWGLAMRIIQAMGLHRDGERWNLPHNVVEERRRLFWECHSAEIFQANCFSRPYTIPTEFIDTRYPSDPVSHPLNMLSYHTMKFELCKVAKDVLHAALCVAAPPYTSILALYDRLHQFERSIPFHLRCRTALVALPSLYSDASIAEAESPEVNRRDLRRTFEQFSLSMMVSETIVNLYRPYFMRALIENPTDPLRSEFGQAYLSVVERSNVIIQIVCRLYAIHPSVTARHWWCWYHAFNSAVCLGTLILMCPKNELVPIALGAMDQVIGIYTDIVQSRSTSRLVQNLRWLLRLRQRAVDRTGQVRERAEGSQGPDSDTETDAGLLGWRTRLIERAARGGRQKATSIQTKSPASTGVAVPGDFEKIIRSIPQAIQEHVAAGIPSTGSMSESPSSQIASTDQLLHQFWDPMMSNQDSTSQTPQLSWWDLVSQPPVP